VGMGTKKQARQERKIQGGGGGGNSQRKGINCRQGIGPSGVHCRCLCLQLRRGAKKPIKKRENRNMDWEAISITSSLYKPRSGVHRSTEFTGKKKEKGVFGGGERRRKASGPNKDPSTTGG